MFVFDTAALLTARRAPDATAPKHGIRRLPARLLAAAAAHRDLVDRGRSLPRPARCGWLPRRAWRRHGALICLRAGIDPDAAPTYTYPEGAGR
ncbi:hypothetical protein [uncultured Thiohalocapsa sp.]|uniref:hypothetical protein n=1 Tax=uncultured Thiohalocapsa sp. TaxID=768990 RepID=UPI0025D2072A|nr:hypothetical protein [uncultured Thiohalocapsa sp.]